MQVTERSVIKTRKNVGTNGPEITDVNLALTVTRGGSEHGEMPHGDDGSLCSDGTTSGELCRVMIADRVADLTLHILHGFSGAGLTKITLTQKRHRRDDSTTEINDRPARMTKDMHVKMAQQLTRSIEMGGGVMVATRDDGFYRLEVGEPFEEIKVQRDGILWGIRRIKNISTEQQCVDFFGTEGFNQPVEKSGMFRQALALNEACAEVPVCRVEESHGGANKGPAPVWRKIHLKGGRAEFPEWK